LSTLVNCGQRAAKENHMERMNITAIRTNGSPVTQQFDYDGSPHQAVFTCGRRAATGRLGLVIATLQDWDDDAGVARCR
jgi:hypothetical protein